jgi:hypothetical protein
MSTDGRAANSAVGHREVRNKSGSALQGTFVAADNSCVGWCARDVRTSCERLRAAELNRSELVPIHD